jgi:hypothetical protein
MSRKSKTIVAGIGIVVLAAAAVLAIQTTANDAVARGGPGGRDVSKAAHVDPDVSKPLTTGEAEALAYMREEEKLAGDVYALLGVKYGSRVFTNITRSEAQHTETVKSFLTAFNLADPSAGRLAGSFEDEQLQTLYRQLVDQGAKSLEDALRVGVAIEERDIADLRARIAATDRADLKAMYGNLLRASQKHLSAFTRQLDGSAGGVGQGQGAGQGYGRGAGQGQGAGQGRGAGQGGCQD